LQTHCTIPSVNKTDKVFHLFAQSLIISKKRLPRFLPYYKHGACELIFPLTGRAERSPLDREGISFYNTKCF